MADDAAALEELPTVDENGQPLSKNALKKLLKARQIAEKKAKKAAEAAGRGGGGSAPASGSVESGSGSDGGPEEAVAPWRFSDLGVVMSAERRPDFAPAAVAQLGVPGGPGPGDEVVVRGRLATVRGKGSSAFLVVRAGSLHTVQAVFFRDASYPRQSKEMLSALQSLTEESVVEVEGRLQPAEVLSCSQDGVEIAISKVRLVSAAAPKLPFEIEDAARSEAEVDASEHTDRPLPRIGQELRLNNRWVDLRVPANSAILRVKASVCALFRESLGAQGFLEIQTPKLVAGESEGGADVFRTDYFGTPACLAQSPQLYKQMAIASDFDRVFEVGPVFRAENSNTRRHLCEFVGLDMEMSLGYHYDEVIEVLHAMFVHIFDGLETRCAPELAAVRAQFPSDKPRCAERPTVVHWEEAEEMLAEDGAEAPPGLSDLSTAQERRLGELVAAKYGVDLYFLDRFPAAARPFYTMPAPDDPDYSNSYDIFLRGEEICSGAQRIHDPSMLEEAIAAKGVAVGPALSTYIESMRYGMPPHGGAGIGLERLVFLYLNLDNVRKASMFPRDPNRCSP